MKPEYSVEVDAGERFGFGKNWASFLEVLDETRIEQAVLSLRLLLRTDSLVGKTFLDIGSGSGLFSLAAMRLGADLVHSFDYDSDSVACAYELRRRYYPNSPIWHVEQASALDTVYTSQIGKFDVVYSWGVLHHTGGMWRGLENASMAVKKDGILAIAIYNDQGVISQFWRVIKRSYNSNMLGRILMVSVFVPYFFTRGVISDIAQRKNPMKRFSDYKKARGMSLTHDWIDWIGGLPFEVASPNAIFEFFNSKGFTLCKLHTVNGLGCNQYVFRLNANNVVKS